VSLLEPGPGVDPFALFSSWYAANAATKPKHPDAMALATSTRDGKPSVRMVLLKGVEAGTFRFFTNYHSQKSQELGENPRAALVFYWPAIERQVRVEGTVARLSEREADAYFATRPRESQLSAYASPQSEVITREELERRRDEIERRFAGSAVSRPEHWGGFGLVPDRFEFWISDPTRLHRRHCYWPGADGWVEAVLAP
jgi:pyridoxamine 5'-phosphate oxidase